jgi:hypothetical protein
MSRLPDDARPGIREQVEAFVLADETFDLIPADVDYGKCMVDDRAFLRIVELVPPVLVRGKTIRFALCAGDEVQGVSEIREHAEVFLEGDDANGHS